ncbi:MAG TPA: ABC transporter ATP-binding protein [Stellaceae bacterium]|nr:ABC transporter ATP-binding protein [Stellaceae bacterium]
MRGTGQNLQAPRGSALGRLYCALWHYAAAERPRVVGFAALLLASQAVKLTIPYLTGEAVDAMQRAGGPHLALAARDMALIFAACLLGWVLHGPGRVIERLVATGIRRRFTDALYAKIAGLPMSWHEDHHSGATIQRLDRAAAALFNFSQHQFIYLQNGVNLAGPIAALFLLSVPTGIAALLGYVAIAIVLVVFDARMVRLNRAQNAAEHQFGAALADCLGNISTVIALRLQQATRRMLGDRLEAVFVPLRRSIVLNEAKWCAIDLLNNGIRCFLVVLYAWLAYRSQGGILLGSAVMVYQYAQQAGSVVSSMAGNYQELVRYQTDFADAAPILDLAPPAASGARPIPAAWREIRVQGLAFAYARERRRAASLRDISLTLRRGGRIALIGPSGSGKSTLLRLLAGLYRPDRAGFAIDGTSRPDLRDLGAIAMLVPQEPEIFESSIGQNITMGLAYPPAAIHRACAVAEFAPILAALPSGLATHIAERGINLSGGQKQRLALARGILAAESCSLILLDEPTSSLDPETEARIYDNLLAAFPGACIVSAIHRLHLLPRFDTVVIMADGGIVDAGSLDELLKRQAGFRALWFAYTEGAAVREGGQEAA